MDTDFSADAQYWQQKPKGQGVMAYPTPDHLREAACEAFDWMTAHPKKRAVTACYKGVFAKTTENLERPFTHHALCLVMGISRTAFAHYRAREEFAEVMEWIDDVIYTQKFEGAATGLLNANFIARDLGLAERNEITGKDGGPVRTQDVNEEERLIEEARRLGIDPAALGIGNP